MKRLAITAISLVACLTGVSATVAAANNATAHSATSATVQLRKTAKGKILVNAKGFTLYMFAKDPKNGEACQKISGCLKVWPALINKKPTAGAGVKASKLSTIKLPNGSRQVTYAGHPLYGYVSDDAPGDTAYIGISQSGGAWWALNANGAIIK